MQSSDRYRSRCVCSRTHGVTGRSLLTAPGHASVALGVTGLGLRTDISHVVGVSCPSFAREVDMTGRSHGCGRFSPLTARGHRLEAGELGGSCGRVW